MIKKNFPLSIFSFLPSCTSFKNSLLLPIPRTLSHKLSLYARWMSHWKFLFFSFIARCWKNPEITKQRNIFSSVLKIIRCVFLFSVRSYLGHLDSSFNIFFRLAINNKLEQLQRFFILLLFDSLLHIVI